MKKIFWGWVIVVAAIFYNAFNSLLFLYGFTAFVDPILKTFKWSSAQVSLASSMRGLETGSMDPLVGWAADRWPARRLMIIGIVIYVAGVIIISRSVNLGMFYAGFLTVGLGGAISVTMIPSTVIARWFKKNIGKASALMAAGTALGGMFAPLLVKAIDAFTWQDTLTYLSLGLLVLGIPIALVFRNSPEEYGMLPDGHRADETNKQPEVVTGVTLKEALKMRSFWFFGIGTMLQMVAINAMTVHMMPYLTNIGIEREKAAIAITTFSFVTLGARLLYGVLADIFSKKYVMTFSMAVTAIAIFIYQLLDGSSYSMVIVFSVIYGIGVGGAMTLRTPIIREYFGVKRFGTIFGILALFLTFGTAIGPPVAGWVFDTRGEYFPIWYILAGLTAIGTVMMITIGRPEVSADARTA